MNAQEQVLAERVVAAVAADTVADVRLVLHPYLHWSEHGQTLRGRTTVLTMLESRPTLDPPVRVELRDGQIYRWYAGD
ncbi:MAG TPA: hypothetical protein VFU98_05000 [Microlunatus sp.]|nr:hypothetical protein [Microlunatus sp.]